MRISVPPLPTGSRAALHLLGLWALAVAQPVFDVLQRSPEFFVAHRTGPLDLVTFVLVLSALVPLLLFTLRWAAGRLWRPAGDILQFLFVAVLAGGVASHALASWTSLGVAPHLLTAALVGLGAACCYALTDAGRLFATVLAPAIVFCPAFFLLQPRLTPFLQAHDVTTRAAANIPGQPPPVVLVIFDQLPLVSLMDQDGALDTATYPGFASLASDATWYRNDTTVAELTGWAVPAILTGLTPRPNQLPTTRNHPNNLFTYLGERYRFEVVEPVTHLCPTRLCPAEDSAWWQRQLAMQLDTAVVYLHTTLPAGLREQLPPLTDNWKNFIDAQHWQRRWVSERDSDRRRRPLDFIEGISRSDPQPTLYFLHALLPHEPYVYFRTGQQFAEATPLYGLTMSGLWTRNEWPVLQAYQRHLAQVRYVDTLVGRLVARLKAEGLFDKSLVVVTADHGVSFRPGRPFKGVALDTLADIASVPLFVKLPNQHGGRVDDRNVQSVDILPTLADLLDADLSWRSDGESLLAPTSRGTEKLIVHTGATQRVRYDTGTLVSLRHDAVDRKLALFGRSPRLLAPPIDAAPSLVGRRITGLNVEDGGSVRAVVEDPDRFETVDPSGPTPPAYLTGRAFDDDGQPVAATLAVAVNGVIAATTRTYFDQGWRSAGWSVLVDPKWFRPGHNDIDVLAVDSGRNAPVLERAYSNSIFPEDLNLSSRAAEDFWSVDQDGMYDREGDDEVPFRWTNGDATMLVPLERQAPPKSLRVGVRAIPAPHTPLRVLLNDCVLFDGRVDDAPWQRTFPLTRCAAAVRGKEVQIELKSPPVVERKGRKDERQIGVAVETVNFFREPWPPAPAPAAHGRAIVRDVGGTRTYTRGDLVALEVRNAGDTVWLDAKETSRPDAAVDLVFRWRTSSALRTADAHATAEQRLTLPYAIFPGDRWRVSLPLVPPPSLTGAGPWDVDVLPVARDGTAMPLQDGLVLHVVPDEAARMTTAQHGTDARR